ncbi:protein D3-like [Pollicipes pollicipes]|uniref:protein D3-like n=1 Tax=Pollicipes pollicipes TaxID=41117 RepID=UPI001884B528|nr:protein D3-like [Pollicipes pollicipes]
MMDALSKLISDVFPAAPGAKVEVRYPSGVSADCGNELTPTQVKERPKVSWQADPGTLHTLIMTDPDAPSRTDRSMSEVRHWLMINIPGCQVDKGDEVSEYIGSGAPKGTGLHRYVFLVYRQPDSITVDPSLRVTRFQRGSRPKWSAQKFALEHGLGAPLAGNAFQAQYDDYVPILHQQLSG